MFYLVGETKLLHCFSDVSIIIEYFKIADL